MNVDLPEGFVKTLVGYCDPLSERAGGSIGFYMSSDQAALAHVSVVKLISGDDRPHGTGLIESEIVALAPVEVGNQPLIPGSYAVIPDMPPVDRGRFDVWVFPTLLESERRCVANLAGLTLWVSDAGFECSGVCVGAGAMLSHRWYRVSIRIDEAPEISVRRVPLSSAEQEARWSSALPSIAFTAGDWVLAASEPGKDHFNGRIEHPICRVGDDRVLGEWDFSRRITESSIEDVSGNARHGCLFQTPTRAVRGRLWDGSAQSFHDRPEHYGAIHFHEDDLTDAGWTQTLTWQIPATLPSGQYALKVQAAGSEDYIPFFVRPAPGERGSDLVYLVPTASYLAYANQRVQFSGGMLGSSRIRTANDAFLFANPQVGYSLYEHHRDGSGVHFSSRLRPILNMKPRCGTWAFNADTHITAWLDAMSQPFDVVTDEDLHLEGAAALEGYRAVITGSHPEYYSSAMRQGLESWLSNGGRLMYMGGNGFYWRIAYCQEQSGIIEVRRAEDGTRAWIAAAGEYYHQFNGEYGGMWRRLGKPPNQLVGIGFAAQGFDGGTYYRVQPGALDPRVGFIIDGVTETDVWGDYGNQGGGAAGEEIDRYDASLGSPPHTVVIASSENHRPGMLRVKEEFHMMEPPGDDPKVRADMVFFEVPNGGAVFSTGSISYTGALAHNDYDNDIARITNNVLTRFLDSTRFELPTGQ